MPPKPKGAGLPWEENVARFRRRFERLPDELKPAAVLWYARTVIQRQRIRANNQFLAVTGQGDKKFAWAHVVPEQYRQFTVPFRAETGGRREWVTTDLNALFAAALKGVSDVEAQMDAAIERAITATDWYREVALEAAVHQGMGPQTAAALAALICSPSLYPHVSSLYADAGLDVRDGKAPSRLRKEGHRAPYRTPLLATLYKLFEVWNRMPDSYWRLRIDYWKIIGRERHPDEKEWPSWRIHNYGFRRTAREFLARLYTVWSTWEAERGLNQVNDFGAVGTGESDPISYAADGAEGD